MAHGLIDGCDRSNYGFIDCFGAVDNKTFGIQELRLFPATKAADGAAQIAGLGFREKTSAVDTFGQQAQLVKLIWTLGDKVASHGRILCGSSGEYNFITHAFPFRNSVFLLEFRIQQLHKVVNSAGLLQCRIWQGGTICHSW